MTSGFLSTRCGLCQDVEARRLGAGQLGLLGMVSPHASGQMPLVRDNTFELTQQASGGLGKVANRDESFHVQRQTACALLRPRIQIIAYCQ